MNILIKNTNALLYNGAKFEVSHCDISISGEKILSTGAIPDGFNPEKIIDGSEKLVIPGLINAHTHAYMTVFRNCADDLLFNDWLFGRIMPLEEKLTKEDCYWGTLLGCMEMISTGTTSFLDMYIFADSAARAVTDCGMRAVMSRGLTGGPDDVEGGARRLREAKNEIREWSGRGNLSFMLAPHAPYTCGENYLLEIAATARELNVGIHTHLSESLSETETVKSQYGCTPAEYFDRTGILTDRTVAAHCVQLTQSDIDLLAERGVSVATNPVSNLKLANGIAPIPKLMEAGVNVALGTDGTASNNCLNMFRDLSFLSLLHKGINHNAVAVTAQDALKAATVNGAKALGLSGITGEIKAEMKADLAIMDMESLNMFPNNDPVAALCYSCNGSEVETVIVNGKILMENRIFTTIDKERVMYEVGQICRRTGTAPAQESI